MKSNEQLCKEIQQGNTSSVELLFNQNIAFIYSLLNRFHIPKDEKEDAFSCAKIGLIKAAKSFDLERGIQFSTYSFHFVLGEIKKYFRDNSSIHFSRTYKELYYRCVRAQEEIEQDEGRSANIEEIAKKLSLSTEEVLVAYESHNNLISLDSPTCDDEISLHEILTVETNQRVKTNLLIALSELDKKERLIIQLRYYEGFTQQEVAKRLSISQVQISRLEKQILEKLKVNI